MMDFKLLTLKLHSLHHGTRGCFHGSCISTTLVNREGTSIAMLVVLGSLDVLLPICGDSISAIYLPLFEDFEIAGRYSWASSVLSYLYRELCLATKPGRKQFGGSILLLQLWSWERFPIGRPRNRRNVEGYQLGGDDLIRRPPWLWLVWIS